MARTPKTYRFPELGLEFMASRVMNPKSGRNLASRLANPDQEKALAAQIEELFPGQGWRVPSLAELKIMGGLAQLELDVDMSTQDHFYYYLPVVTSTDLPAFEFREGYGGKACLLCVRPKGNSLKAKTLYKERVGDTSPTGTMCKVLSSNDPTIKYEPLVRLVRDI